jgi:hypothetical protein
MIRDSIGWEVLGPQQCKQHETLWAHALYTDAFLISSVCLNHAWVCTTYHSQTI